MQLSAGVHAHYVFNLFPSAYYYVVVTVSICFEERIDVIARTSDLCISS